MIRPYFLFIFLILPQLAIAQPVFKRINTANGLSNNTVLTILQDRKGFMWFGTDDGLNKYDGHAFRIFKPDFKNKKSISHNIAKILFEDHAGNIWIGTDGGGLNKFNPITEEFTSFYFEESNLTGLNHNNVTALAEEDNRYLWIGTYGGGLNRLDLKHNTFEHFVNEEGNANTVASQYINSLVFDDKGNLWIGTWGRGLDKLNVRSMKFTNFQHHNGEGSLSDNTVNHVLIDANKNIWIATWEGGLNLYEPQTQSFEHFMLKEKSLSTNNIRYISADNNNNLWLASFGDGLIKFNIATHAFENFRNVENNKDDSRSICSNNLWTTYCADDNVLWIGSIEGGMSKLDFSPKKFYNIKSIDDDVSQSDIVDALTETRSGNIFAGTFGKGLIVLDHNLQYSNKMQLALPLISKKINSIIEDSQGVYWIGTDAGITTYDPKNGNTTNFGVVGAKPGLSFPNVKVIYEDHADIIWIGTRGGGLNRFDRKKGTFPYYFASPKKKVIFTVDMGGAPVSSKGVFLAGNFNNWNTSTIPMKQVGRHLYSVTLELYSQKIEYRFLNGDTWEAVPATCASNKNRTAEIQGADVDLGLIKFGESCQRNITTHNDFFANGLTDNHIWCITEDHDGILWIGTNEGLTRFDKINNVFTPYRRINGDSSTLSDNHVSCIYEDKDQNLWIGTLGGGLNLFERATNSFTNFSEKDGLANNIVKAILEDDHHNLWISTNNGLTRFNYRKKLFKNYGQANGLENNSYRIGAAIRRSNGEMLFGGIHGLSRFNPDSITANLSWPKVYITDVLLAGQSLTPGRKINDEVVLDSAVLYTNSVRLKYDQNMITFKFASPEFADIGEPIFSYKLAGFDKQWYESPTTDHVASYTNLPPGEYKFMVRASNQEGLFGNNIAQLSIFIAPPFWETVYFKLLMTLVFAACLYLAYKIVAAKKEEKHREITFLANQKIKDLENENLQNEIDYKNKELATISMNLIEKTKFLNEQIKRLENIANISESDVKSKLNNLIENFNKEITTEKDWEYFEMHFDKVHQNFLSKLKTTFPELSAVDIKLAAFIKMDLSNKEIADLMNKSVRSIESSRYRLRKSLGLNQGDNLSDFLFRF
jgi:ligand-binding sensor domain-containing protein